MPLKCPNCSHPVAGSTKFCRNCGMENPGKEAAEGKLFVFGLGVFLFSIIYFIPLLVFSSFFPNVLIPMLPELAHTNGADVFFLFLKTGKAWVWSLMGWTVVAAIILIVTFAIPSKGDN